MSFQQLALQVPSVEQSLAYYISHPEPTVKNKCSMFMIRLFLLYACVNNTAALLGVCSDAWPGSAGPCILRTPEIAGRRLRREGGLRVAAAREGPRRRRVRGGPQPAQPQLMVGLWMRAGGWSLAAGGGALHRACWGRWSTAAVLLLLLL